MSDPHRWTPERRGEVEAALRNSRTRQEAAQRLRISESSLSHATQTYRLSPRALLGTAPSPPAPASAGVVLGDSHNETVSSVSNLKQEEPETRPPVVIYEPPPPAPPPILSLDRDLSFSLLGDLHAPEHDHPAWDACLRWHADVKPDVIVCSEMGEWGSVTKYGGNWGAMFEDDVKATRRVFVQLRSVCPDSRIVVLEANHDTRLTRRINELMPQMAGHLLIPQELHLADMGIEWVPESLSFRLGRMKMIHGHQLAGAGKVQALPENACKRAIERFGEPGWIVVFWHTHRRGYWGIRRDSGTLEAINLPCLRTLAPDWTKPNPTGWSLGFAGGYIDRSGRTDLYPIGIEHGAFKWAGKRYAARAA